MLRRLLAALVLLASLTLCAAPSLSLATTKAPRAHWTLSVANGQRAVIDELTYEQLPIVSTITSCARYRREVRCSVTFGVATYGPALTLPPQTLTMCAGRTGHRSVDVWYAGFRRAGHDYTARL